MVPCIFMPDNFLVREGEISVGLRGIICVSGCMYLLQKYAILRKAFRLHTMKLRACEKNIENLFDVTVHLIFYYQFLDIIRPAARYFSRSFDEFMKMFS